MQIKLNKILPLITLLFISVFFIASSNEVNAQSAGTLSFNPTSFSASDTTATKVDVVYTGTEITAAEIHVVTTANLKIDSFTPNAAEGLVAIYDDTSAGEIHVGKLSSGNITSGTTLFSMDMTAVNCGTNGTLTFNATETLIPDVTVTFNTASFTTDCNGAPPPTVTQPIVTPPTVTPAISTLPETGVFNDGGYSSIILSSVMLFVGIMTTYYIKITKSAPDQTGSIEIISRDI